MRRVGEKRLRLNLQRAALQEIDAVQRALPVALRARARGVPVMLEPAPDEALLDDGVEADTLGLFVGEAWAEAGESESPLPAQILVFFENLWAYADHDPERFREQVRVTYLHELGHYLGLDEDGLALRELD